MVMQSTRVMRVRRSTIVAGCGRSASRSFGDRRRGTAGQVQHQAGGVLDRGTRQCRIDTALEAVAGIGVQAQLAATAHDRGRREVRGLRNTAVVASVTRVSKPPIRPARPTARSASVTTRKLSSSAASRPSSSFSVSPARERRTAMLPCRVARS